MARHPDEITLLRSWNNRRLTKRFWPEGKEEYDNEHLFDHHYERCGSIERIFETLELLKGGPTIAVVRGRIMDGVGVPHGRKWASEPITMEDARRSWLMVDVDKPVCPISDDWQDNPEPFIREIIRNALPEEFHDAGVVVQWSSSMALMPDGAYSSRRCN